jgi:hypothetical protein
MRLAHVRYLYIDSVRTTAGERPALEFLAIGLDRVPDVIGATQQTLAVFLLDAGQPKVA